MKKCIIVSDSFKGTLSSMDICRIASEVFAKEFPSCELVTIPVADGGEGTVSSIISAVGANAVSVAASNAYFEPCTGIYVRYGATAVIEMAAVAGLPSVGERRNPMVTTTFGVGELISHAIDNGCKNIYLGLGGSATNDGGCGCAAALGVRFYDKSGESFIPTGATLKDIERLDIGQAQKKLNGVSITVMSDVQNPLFGENGAAYVFAPQKGADSEMVCLLDHGLRHFGQILLRETGRDVSQMPGAGAAGGMGAGVCALLGGNICSGIEAILQIADFDSKLGGAQLVISGEGKLDAQSLQGKVISGVASHTKAHGIPLIAIVGCIGDIEDEIYDAGVTAVFATNHSGLPFTELALRAEADYRKTLTNVLRLIRINEKSI